MTDLETRLRRHLEHEAQRIEVPEGTRPGGDRTTSVWSSVLVVPMAATVAVVVLIGFIVLQGPPPSSVVDSTVSTSGRTTMPDTPPTTGPATPSTAVELVDSVPGRGAVFAPSRPTLISAVLDPDRQGCEGFSAASWQVVDLTDGSMTPAGDGTVTGTAIPFGEQIAIVDQCEGFIQSVSLGSFSDEGAFEIDVSEIELGDNLTNATFAADRGRGDLLFVTPGSIRRLDPASGQLTEPEPSPFPVQPTTLAVAGELMVGATFEDALEVGIYDAVGDLVEILPDCAVVQSGASGDVAVASGACGIYVINPDGSSRRFSDAEVLSAAPLPGSDSVLAFTLAPDGAAGGWEIFTPDGARFPVPGSNQSPEVLVSPDGSLLAVPDENGDATTIVTVDSVLGR